MTSNPKKWTGDTGFTTMKSKQPSIKKALGQFKWLLLFAFTTSFAIGARTGNGLHPLTGEVQASAVLESPSKEDNTIVEATPTPTSTPSPTVITAHPTSAPELAVEAVDLTSGEGELEEMIERVFGDKAHEAKLIVGCESRWNPQTVGDTHIMTYHSGELVGDSIGLFQIRTGGHDFNRAKANGMTADEFRQEMFDPEKNIQYAKTIYDQRGWSAWWNCMKKTGV